MYLLAHRPEDRLNAPEKRRYRGTERDIEIVRNGDTLIMRRVVDWPKWRRLAAEVLADMPKPRKGASIMRELNRSRLRGGR